MFINIYIYRVCDVVKNGYGVLNECRFNGYGVLNHHKPRKQIISY